MCTHEGVLWGMRVCACVRAFWAPLPNDPPPVDPCAAPRPPQHCVWDRAWNQSFLSNAFAAHSFCNRTEATCDLFTITTPFGTAEVKGCEPHARARRVQRQGCLAGSDAGGVGPRPTQQA